MKQKVTNPILSLFDLKNVLKLNVMHLMLAYRYS